jgi:hypothetical protein
MTNKTKEAIAVEIVRYGDSKVGITEALAKIIAIVDEERKGEVVLSQGGVLESVEPNPWTTAWKLNKHPKATGQKGRLIFVPEGEK